jgi:hypothetical protein
MSAIYAAVVALLGLLGAIFGSAPVAPDQTPVPVHHRPPTTSPTHTPVPVHTPCPNCLDPHRGHSQWLFTPSPHPLPTETPG